MPTACLDLPAVISALDAIDAQHIEALDDFKATVDRQRQALNVAMDALSDLYSRVVHLPYLEPARERVRYALSEIEDALKDCP